jgi:Na+-transporting NADH:ubiquinone oxidoreductase subunit NqrA
MNTILFSHNHKFDYQNPICEHITTMTLALVKDTQNCFYLVALEDESIDLLKESNLEELYDQFIEGTNEYAISLDKLGTFKNNKKLLKAINKSEIFEFKERIINDSQNYDQLVHFINEELKC